MPRNARKVVPDPGLDSPVKEMPLDDALQTSATRSFFGSLFYFATAWDVVLVTCGCVFKLVFGVLQILILIIFAEFFDMRLNTPQGFRDLGLHIFVSMCYFGAATAGTEMAASIALEWAKHRQITAWKKAYLKSILRQDVGWYDVNRPQELSTRMGEALVHIEKGLHSSNGNLFSNGGQFIGGLVIAVYYSWDIALVTLAIAMLTFVPSVSLLLSFLDRRTKLLADAYSGAGGVASEVLSSIRTVASLGLEHHSLARYDVHIESAESGSIRLSNKIFLAVSTMNASMFYVMSVGVLFALWKLVSEYRGTTFPYTYAPTQAQYCAHVCDPYDPVQLDAFSLLDPTQATLSCSERGPNLTPFLMTCNTGDTILYADGNATIGLWTDQLLSNLTAEERRSSFEEQFATAGSSPACAVTLAVIYIATQAIFQGVMGASQIAAPITALTKGVTACRDVLAVIEREPPIDSFADKGVVVERFAGEIEVRGVVFAYPSAPAVHVCNGYSLHVPAGSSCALVGPSGSGKSTLIQLLERYYDPLSGEVLIDGIDVRTMNVKALRKQIGLVGQEPMLFMGTVSENIALGKDDATREEIEAAARTANAHGFITRSLAKGFGTQVGLGGGKLSGGQKQRIAIARAIIKKPSILLLDEATSALDNASERVVQAALEDIMSQSRFTSVTVAHRLSTIKHCDKIAVVQKGSIVEEGTYDELLAKGEGGVFFGLAAKQQENQERDTETMSRASASVRDSSTAQSPEDKQACEDGEQTGSGAEEETDAGSAASKTKSKKKGPDPMLRLMRMAPAGDGKLYGIGLVCSAITGVGKGFFGLLFMRSLTALASVNPDTVQSEATMWALIFLGAGLAMHCCELIFMATLGVAGEHLVKALRHHCMLKLLQMEIGYFDDDANSTGALTEFLGQKVALVQGVVGERLGTMAQSITMMVSVVFTMFYWGDWRVTLVVLGCFPIMGAAMAVAMAAMMPMDAGKQGKKDKDADVKRSAGSMVGEVVLGIRTVASFNAEIKFYSDYCTQMDEMLNAGKKRALYGGSTSGLAFGTIFLIFGVQLYYGMWLASVGALFQFELTVDATGCIETDVTVYMDKIMVPMMVRCPAVA